MIPFPEYRPDISDLNGNHTITINNVLPRGDGYGPVKELGGLTSALPAACRGYFRARNTDGTVTTFAATSNRIFRLNNTDLTWVPVSKVTTLTSISQASPAVFTKAAHGLSNGDTLVLSTSGALPSPLAAGTVYYVINKADDTFQVSTTSGGSAINTTDAGSGTHSMTYFYTAVPTTDQWQFEQFGTSVIAVQANTAPQEYTLGTDSAFGDLSGSPPTARYIAVVNRQVVLSGLTANPNRIHWSDVDGITTWAAGTGFANTYDLPDGGVVRGVAGGEFGLVFQESAIRRLSYNNGAKPSFQIERITDELGLLGPYSVIRASGRVFFYSSKGFYSYSTVEGLRPIGKERVDRTVAAEIDIGNLQLLIGAPDPQGTRVFWGYKTQSGSASTFNKLLCYDFGIGEFGRWAPADVSGEYLAWLIAPGITLDALDSVSGSIDALTFSLDSVAASGSALLSAANTSHQIALFDGDNLEAVLETAEFGGPKRIYVRGFTPLTDASGALGSVKHRATQQAAAMTTTETAINANGFCPAHKDTRYARARLRIPAGSTWTYATGVEPDFEFTGDR